MGYKLLETPCSFTIEQRQFIDGTMLGDGCLQLARPTSKYPRLRIVRTLADRAYLEWQYSVIQDFCRSGIHEYKTYDNRTNKYYSGCYFNTAMNPLFIELRSRWYPSGKKVVPRDLILSPLMVAIWFCDDGCLIRCSDKNFTIKFATQGFDKDDVDILASKLTERYSTPFNVYLSDGKPIIKAATKSCDALMREIHSYIPNCMPRKKNAWLEARNNGNF